MKRIQPEAGKTYTNHNGDTYCCRAVSGTGSAIMERVTDGWTLMAHGIGQYDDGTIEWDYSTDGHWTRTDSQRLREPRGKE